MEKFAQFGIDPKLLIAQIINFLVLFYILRKLLYKPILGMIKKREEKIKEGLAAGAKGEELLEKAKTEEKEIVGKANQEALALLDETKQRAGQLEEETLAKAAEDADRLLTAARLQIEQDQKAAERVLEGKIAFVATEVLEKILPQVLSREDQIKILAGSEKRLKKVLG